MFQDKQSCVKQTSTAARRLKGPSLMRTAHTLTENYVRSSLLTIIADNKQCSGNTMYTIYSTILILKK